MIREPPSFGFDLQFQRHWVAIFWNPPYPRHWIEFLSGKGPRHVVLMTYLALPGVWIHLDWGMDGHSLCVIEDDEAWRLLAVLHHRGATLLRWSAPEKRPRQFLLAPNCVGWAQKFLGIAGLFWTPPQLLRFMLEAGATPFFDLSMRGDTRGGSRDVRRRSSIGRNALAGRTTGHQARGRSDRSAGLDEGRRDARGEGLDGEGPEVRI